MALVAVGRPAEHVAAEDEGAEVEGVMLVTLSAGLGATGWSTSGGTRAWRPTGHSAGRALVGLLALLEVVLGLVVELLLLVLARLVGLLLGCCLLLLVLLPLLRLLLLLLGALLGVAQLLALVVLGVALEAALGRLGHDLRRAGRRTPWPRAARPADVAAVPASPG